MKNIFTVLGLVLITGSVNSQINVPQIQKSLYGVVEATWCGNCGQHGIPKTTEVIDQAGDEAIFFSLHKSASSELYSSTAEDIANSIGTSGQPYWTLNGIALGGNSANSATSIINSIHANYNAMAADVNAGYEWYIYNDTLYVETKTEFFNAANGDYNVAVYVSEDSIYAYQANYDPLIDNGNIYHSHILRTSASADAFGVPVASGAITAGSSFSNIQKIKIDPTWDLEHIHLSSVVWEDNGANYTFLNANDSGQESAFASIEHEAVNELELSIFPIPSSDKITVNTAESTNATLNIYSLSGELVYTYNVPDSNNNSTLIDVSTFKTGTYIITLNSDNKSTSQQIVIK